MVIKNDKQIRRIKKLFFLVCILIALAALVFLLLDYFMYAIICVVLFSAWYLFFHVADYQYIEYSDENDKITLHYTKAISFGGKAFNSIEFPQQILRKAEFENSVFGKLSDVTFIVKTKRGIAEYPSVSLAAVPAKDRVLIQKSVNQILGV